jgi:hypothetical protein
MLIEHFPEQLFVLRLHEADAEMRHCLFGKVVGGICHNDEVREPRLKRFRKAAYQKLVRFIRTAHCGQFCGHAVRSVVYHWKKLMTLKRRLQCACVIAKHLLKVGENVEPLRAAFLRIFRQRQECLGCDQVKLLSHISFKLVE